MDDWSFLLESAQASWRAAGEPGRVAAAVSGGADSVALLFMLSCLAPRSGFSLSAVHVDHGLRPESGEDAAFVMRLCEKLGIPCRIEKVSVRRPGEMGAREARYDALLSACLQEGAHALALAHHQRDQAETVLLHLLRGSGANGLGGMKECSIRMFKGRRILLWRPFLSVSPEALRRALTDRDIPWREDATNSRDDYLRNYLRRQVLPLIRARVPGAEEALCRASRLISDDNECLDDQARQFLTRHACLSGPCRWIDDPGLQSLHPALRRRCLRLACPVALDSGQTEALMALDARQTANLPEGWRALRTPRYLHFLSPIREEAPLGVLRQLPFTGDAGDGVRTQAIPRALFAQCVLRRRETGDRIRPLGGPGDKSLQDYWVDRLVDRPFRDHLPVLCVGRRVIWSVGVGVSEEGRVAPGSDAVYLRYEGYLPGESPD